MKTTVSERGQITLPKAVRTSLGIKPGTVIDISVAEGKFIGVKKEAEDPFQKWRGRGKLPGRLSSVDEYLEATRG